MLTVYYAETTAVGKKFNVCDLILSFVYTKAACAE